MKPLAIVLSSVLVALGLLLASPAAASPERGDEAVVQQNPPHSGGGGTPAGTAAPRGGESTGGSSSGSAGSPSGGSATASGGGGMSSAGSGGGYAGSPRYRGSGESARTGAVGQAVPRDSRPRGDRPVTGTAVPRGDARPPDGGGYYPVYPSYPGYYPGYGYPYYGYGYGYGYWGLGLGFYYDPFWWGFSPWSGGYPYGYGYGYGGYGYGGASYGQSDQLTGEIKLKVKPKEAEVYVDGYFVGIVDDFDGAFQHLTVRSGQPHRIEVRRPGFETLGFEVNVEPGQSVAYRGEMQKAQ